MISGLPSKAGPILYLGVDNDRMIALFPFPHIVDVGDEPKFPDSLKFYFRAELEQKRAEGTIQVAASGPGPRASPADYNPTC